MKTLRVAEIERMYANFGQHAEQALAYTLMGEIRTHGDKRFFAGSDIPEYAMSVKTGGFTLATGTINGGNTIAEKWENFANMTASTCFAFVTTEMVAYIMDMEEFKTFVFTWCRLEKDSAKNGGQMKIRCRHESKKMLAWLKSQAA